MLGKALALLWLVPLCSLAQGQGAAADPVPQTIAEYSAALAAWQQSGISTSLDDARTDAAFLDGYEPPSFAPLAEMPRCPGRGYLLVAPGAYAMDAASFCLQAGSHGPGGGDGYVLAPLKGCTADLVSKAVESWAEHPEISHEEVQVLVWVLESRTSPDRLPERRAKVAASLLGEDGVAQARAQARGPEPAFLEFPTPAFEAGEGVDPGATEATNAALDEAVRELEALAQRMEAGEAVDPAAFAAAMERLAAAQAASSQALEEALAPVRAQMAQMEPLLTALEATFEEMAARAVPSGTPAPPEGSRVIPAGRWSYHPGGMFVRYLPEHFTRTRVEALRPGEPVLVRDAAGRLECVSGFPGRELRLRYAPDEAEAGAESAPDAWLLAGLEVSDGARATATVFSAPVPLGAAAATEDDVAPHLAEAGRLLAQGGTAEPDNGALGDCVDLFRLTRALRPLTEAGDEVAAAATDIAREAWMAAICRANGGGPRGLALGARADERLACVDPAAGVRLALLPATSSLVAAGAGGGDGLPWLNPGRDGLVPGNRGRQRLTTGPVQHPDSLGKEVLEHAVKSCEILQTALAVVSGVTDPVGWLMEQFGLGTGGLPGMILGEMIQMMFDLGAQIAQALGGDPPRADYDQLDAPPRALLPDLGPAEGNEGERRAATLQAAEALAVMVAHLQAAQVAMDRMGGANQAGDDGWVWLQATDYVYHKRAAAESMVEVGEQWGGVYTQLDEEGPAAPEVDREAIRRRQDRLRTEGWGTASQEAMARLGMDGPQTEAARQRALALALEDDPAGLVDLGLEASAALRELGELWGELPRVADPSKV